MPLYKRKSTWWVTIVTPTGERIRRSTGTNKKSLAKEFEDKLKADLWRIFKLGDKPRRLWNEAVVLWLKEQSHKATIEEDKSKLRWLDQFLGGKPIDTISRELIGKITDAKLGQGVTNATVNRTLEVLRAILRKCVNEGFYLLIIQLILSPGCLTTLSLNAYPG